MKILLKLTRGKNFSLPKRAFSGYKYKADYNFRITPFLTRDASRGILILETAVIETTTFNPSKISADESVPKNDAPVAPALSFDELAFELGLWLSGLESFLNIQNHAFGEENRVKAASRDWTKEFRLTHSTLLHCSSLNFKLAQALRNDLSSNGEKAEMFDDFSADDESPAISAKDTFALSMTLKDVILLSEGLLRAAPLKFGEWTAWSNSLSGKLKKVAAFDKLIKSAEKTGENFLPEQLQNLLKQSSLPAATEADLKLILPRFGKILKWLDVIEKMVRQDKPLKPALLIFARVFEQIQELTTYVNNRLLRFPNEEDALFGALDGAVYIASIEIKKVYQYELTGLTDIRPTPLVRAKIEAAQGLLNDSFQQTLVSFAWLIDPSVELAEIFPVFKTKIRDSLVLRHDLWSLMQDVQTAEQNPGKYPIDELNKKLLGFVETSMRFLMYKDWETFERFVEEIVITSNRKDLTPLLHRFGAYLETLFGQVNMRGVLANHPFQTPAKQ